MSVDYPVEYKSDYSINFRKTIKLCNALYDDWYSYENGYGDNEWYPNHVSMYINGYAEDDENNEIETNFIMAIEIDDARIEFWVDGNRVEIAPVSEWNFNEYEGWSEKELETFVEAIENMMVSIPDGSSSRVESIYDELDEEIEEYEE